MIIRMKFNFNQMKQTRRRSLGVDLVTGDPGMIRGD
jgi:hypothetical protein